MLADALALARELQHKYMQTQVLLYQVQVLVHLGQLGPAREAADELASLIAETGDREPESRLYVAMAEILGRSGDLEGARAYADRAHLAALAAHAKGVQVRALAIQAWLALAAGNYQDVRALSKDGLALSTRIGAKAQTAQLYLALGEASLALGQEGAAEAFDLVEAIADEVASPVLRAQALFGQAAARPVSGHAHVLAAEARDLLEDFAAGLDAEARDAFFAIKERRRILDGDYVGFSQTISNESRISSGQPPRLGLDQGMWRLL
jgi:hypothetical protein